MRYGIGIDTGGTYTDAVFYDFLHKKILGSAKAPTTRHDLSVGIMEALDKLPNLSDRQIDLISLSTTLATNACVENKIGRARLVFFGGDRGTIDRYGGEFGMPPSAEIWLEDCRTTFAGTIEREPDWQHLLSRLEENRAELDGLGVIETFSMKNGAVIEREAKKLIEDASDIPVVCGYELSSELSCLQRGAGTLLNAGLFPIIKSFIAAIKRAMAERGIAAPVVIVRSDGSLMGEEFASLRPVETLLCGPAASVMGAVELSGEPNCVIIDMGGTTTDVAIVRNGEPVRAESGIGIGKWRTFVKGLYINTFGLGGDSAVHYQGNRMLLEDYRVVPLCMTESAHPGILAQLAEELEAQPRHTRYMHEFFVLVRDIAEQSRYTELEKRFCGALRGGPLIRRRAAAAVGRDEYTLDVSRLIREGVVQVSGLTPTDAMHLRGDFTLYPTAAARAGAAFVAENLGISVEKLCEKVYEEVKKKLYMGVARTLLLNENPDFANNGFAAGAEALLEAGYRNAKSGKPNRFIAAGFRTDLALVGIGAPVHIFLDDVAAWLGTRAVLSPHSGVANALGAIVGKIHARCEIPVRPDYNLNGIAGYVVAGNDGNHEFEEREAAEKFALSEADRGARSEALNRGAVGEIAVTTSMEELYGHSDDAALYLGSRAVAHAVGAICL